MQRKIIDKIIETIHKQDCNKDCDNCPFQNECSEFVEN